MKKYLLTIALLLPLAVMAQTKPDSIFKGWSASDHISMNTFSTSGTVMRSRIDTVACYFLKVPAEPSISNGPIYAQWYLGWEIQDYSPVVSYLYLDKQPVKEQVLISIRKDK